MASNDNTRGTADTQFSYGERELRQSALKRELRIETAPLKAANEKLGFDPYNTSGSFDRKNNWMRVGKR